METTTQSSGEDVHSYTRNLPAIFHLNERDIRRWRLAGEAMRKYGLSKPDTTLYLVTLKPVSESSGLFVTEDRNSIISMTATLGFALVAAAYGGLHALAWNAPFPTRRELKLWRGSTVIIVSPAAMFLAFILSSYVVITGAYVVRLLRQKKAPSGTNDSSATGPPARPVSDPKPKTAERPRFTFWPILRSTFKVLGKVVECLWVILGPNILFFFYFPARVYLVYESLRTVFFLPPDAYKSADWTSHLPHIT